MLETLLNWFGDAQQWLFESAFQPLLFNIGAASVIADAYNGTGWLLAGILQIVVMLLLIAPLQRWRPAEAVAATPERRRAVWVDVVYTLIHRLGLFRVAVFFAIEPLWNALFGWMAVHGVDGWHLDQAIAPWWPGVTDTALVGFLAYLIVFDLIDYWLHRGQHHFDAWWALHALHHSQRHMTLWTDNRNHLLDDLVRDLILALVARAIGVAPEQFMALVVVGRMLESLSHANVQMSFGRFGQRVLVGPKFHRVHHAIGIGHESGGQGTLGGHNFAVLFPVWDILFGTARFDVPTGPTGIRDQLPEHGGRDYGEGFWAQQRLGLLRIFGRA